MRIVLPERHAVASVLFFVVFAIVAYCVRFRCCACCSSLSLSLSICFLLSLVSIFSLCSLQINCAWWMEWATYLDTKLMCMLRLFAAALQLHSRLWFCFLFFHLALIRVCSTLSYSSCPLVDVDTVIVPWKYLKYGSIYYQRTTESLVNANMLPFVREAFVRWDAIGSCRGAFSFVSCHVVTQQQMIWIKLLSPSHCDGLPPSSYPFALAGRKRCVFLFISIVAVHGRRPLPASRDDIVFVTADFVLSLFVVSDREMERNERKKVENASRAKRTSELLTVQQCVGAMMMVDGVCARAITERIRPLMLFIQKFQSIFSRARLTPPRRSSSFALFLFVLVAGWRVGAFDSELGLKLAHFKAEVGRACSRFACRCLLLSFTKASAFNYNRPSSFVCWIRCDEDNDFDSKVPHSISGRSTIYECIQLVFNNHFNCVAADSLILLSTEWLCEKEKNIRKIDFRSHPIRTAPPVERRETKFQSEKQKNQPKFFLLFLSRNEFVILFVALCGRSSPYSCCQQMNRKPMNKKNETNFLWRDVHAIVIARLFRKMFYFLEMSTSSTAVLLLLLHHRAAKCGSKLRCSRHG